MRKLVGLSAGLVLVFLAGCAPVFVQPRELVSSLPYSSAYAAVVRAIATQPYPASTSGWVITHASQVDGFISTRLTERECTYFYHHPFGMFGEPRCRSYDSYVTVTLVKRPDGQTAATIGTNGTTQATRLATSIREALELTGVPE